MPLLSFTKAVALGNDFILIDTRGKSVTLTPEMIKILADRRRGVGCDQLIFIMSATTKKADIRLKLFNADGSEAGACGNGTRSVAWYLMKTEGLKELKIQTAGTICQATLASENNDKSATISVVLGKPRFDWDHIPLANPEALRDVSYNTIASFCVNVGNPHAVFFVGDVDEVPLASIGPKIERHQAFPERINVGFAQIINGRTLRLRVWERGAGYTMACGTGACAAAVAAIHQKLITSGQSPLRVIQDGGEIFVDWREGHPITMTGPAEIVYHGEIDI